MTEIPQAVRDGAIHREALVRSIVDEFAPPGSHTRFHTYGAVRMAVLKTVLDLAGVYPQLSSRIQARFGTCNTE